MSLRFISTILLGLLFSYSAKAVDLGENVSVTGFIAPGFSHGLSNDDNEDDYEPIIETGVHSSIVLPNNLMLNGQVLYRDVSIDEQKEEKAKLDYLTIDWSTQGPWESEQTISLGRFKTTSNIYGGTLDIPLTRPSIILAQSVYSEHFRSLISNLDGIRLASNFLVGEGDLNIELGYGAHNTDENFDIIVSDGSEITAVLDMDSSWLIDLKYRYSDWTYSVSYREIDDDYRLNDNSSVGRLAGKLNTTLFSLGVQYQKEALELTVEGIKLVNKYSGSNVLTGIKDELHGIYGQVRYFLSSDIALMLRYDTVEYDFDSSANYNVQWIGNYHTWSTGITWCFAEDWQLSFEVHERKQGDTRKTTTLGQIAWQF